MSIIHTHICLLFFAVHAGATSAEAVWGHVRTPQRFVPLNWDDQRQQGKEVDFRKQLILLCAVFLRYFPAGCTFRTLSHSLCSSLFSLFDRHLFSFSATLCLLLASAVHWADRVFPARAHRSGEQKEASVATDPHLGRTWQAHQDARPPSQKFRWETAYSLFYREIIVMLEPYDSESCDESTLFFVIL